MRPQSARSLISTIDRPISTTADPALPGNHSSCMTLHLVKTHLSAHGCHVLPSFPLSAHRQCKCQPCLRARPPARCAVPASASPASQQPTGLVFMPPRPALSTDVATFKPPCILPSRSPILQYCTSNVAYPSSALSNTCHSPGSNVANIQSITRPARPWPDWVTRSFHH